MLVCYLWLDGFGTVCASLAKRNTYFLHSWLYEVHKLVISDCFTVWHLAQINAMDSIILAPHYGTVSITTRTCAYIKPSSNILGPYLTPDIYSENTLHYTVMLRLMILYNDATQ